MIQYDHLSLNQNVETKSIWNFLMVYCTKIWCTPKSNVLNQNGLFPKVWLFNGFSYANIRMDNHEQRRLPVSYVVKLTRYALGTILEGWTQF